jgi:hypothetical protein
MVRAAWRERVRGALGSSLVWPFDHAWIWGLGYLVLIPCFAALYVGFADGFVQTTATHEPAFERQQRLVASDFERATLDQIARGDNRPDPKIGVKVEDVTADPTSISLKVDFFDPAPPRSGPGANLVVARVNLRQGEIVKSVACGGGGSGGFNGEGGGGSLTYCVPYTIDQVVGAGGAPSQAWTLFSNGPVGPEGEHEVSMQDKAFADIMVLSRMSTGVVAGLPDQNQRMLYFSMVTATTLGFGDIAPTTTITRLLVGDEAVLGVVFVGLFLNALSRRRSKFAPLSTETGHSDGLGNGGPDVR